MYLIELVHPGGEEINGIFFTWKILHVVARSPFSGLPSAPLLPGIVAIQMTSPAQTLL